MSPPGLIFPVKRPDLSLAFVLFEGLGAITIKNIRTFVSMFLNDS